jgi:hypothetical protein
MQSIRPSSNELKKRNKNKEGGSQNDIRLADFIKIFRSDDISDNLIKVINADIKLKNFLKSKDADPD